MNQRVSIRGLEEDLLTASSQPVIAGRLVEGHPDTAPQMQAPHVVVKQKAASVEEKSASTIGTVEERKHALQRAVVAV